MLSLKSSAFSSWMAKGADFELCSYTKVRFRSEFENLTRALTKFGYGWLFTFNSHHGKRSQLAVSSFPLFIGPQYSEPAAPPVDPYSDAYNVAPVTAAAPASATESRDPPRGRSRSRSPPRSAGYRSPYRGSGGSRRSPPPRRPPHAPIVRI